MTLITRHKKKVLIADDSAFMRKLITDIINSDDELEVVAQARDGRDALQKIRIFEPDVVTLDVEMPVMDGLATLDRIMENSPLPVIMLSAFTQAGAVATIKALEMGAVDFVTKPGGAISPKTAEIREEIIRKIKTASGASIGSVTRRINQAQPAGIKMTSYGKSSQADRLNSLVIIGTSTGGPKALNEVMSRFTRRYSAAVLIVQHMPPGFTKSLAQRLDANSIFAVKEAEQGDEVCSGMAYVAPGDYHMEVNTSGNKYTVKLHQSPAVNGHRPSVDVLMNSAAKIHLPKIGVIMTGMGSDGAQGMKSLKEAGALNIGENEETCVVYSMPKAAKRLGALDHEVPVHGITECIENALTKKEGGGKLWI